MSAWKGWTIPGVNGGFRTLKAAKRHIWEHGMVGVKPVRVGGPSPRKKNPTKAQKRPNKLQRLMASTKRAKQNRVAAALKKFLHQANPAIETSGAMITKLKGGGFTIRPIKAVKRGSR